MIHSHVKLDKRRRKPPFSFALSAGMFEDGDCAVRGGVGSGLPRHYNMAMRIFIYLALLVSAGVRAQGVADAIEITQRFANSGASQIALARVEQLQPATAAAPRWGDWEQLRCALLYRLSRYPELAQRAAALPAGVPETAARFCLLQGARAAIATAQGAAARELLARLMWRSELSGDEMRQARLLTIESYLAQNRPQDAYALMLRYQQDYRPLDRDTAARFVEVLLAAGMEKEAVNWFSQLDDASAVKLQMRLATNLITADEAIVQARAALARAPLLAAYWVVLQRAAALQNNSLLQAEALENLLQLAEDKSPERMRLIAADLWKSYLAASQDVANKSQLLIGDDTNWAEQAARSVAGSPVGARVLYAYLAQQSKTRDTRLNAQLQLVFSLQGSKLGLAAVRMFDDAARFPVGQLDPHARYLLGSIALEHNLAPAAAGYWQGLATPSTLDADEWRMRLAQTLVRAGIAGAGADALRTLIAGRKTLPEELARRAVSTVQELQDTGNPKLADELYRALLPFAGMRERRDILLGLGRIAETGADYQRASDYFLEAAMLVDAGEADAVAVTARIAAAANLGRAGFKDDARSQFEWLRKNIKDPEKLELIRREMQKL